MITACGDRPFAELDGVVIDALRLGAYQLLRTRIPPHAAVSVVRRTGAGGRAARRGRLRQRGAAPGRRGRPGHLDRSARPVRGRRSARSSGHGHRPSAVDRQRGPGPARGRDRRARAGVVGRRRAGHRAPGRPPGPDRPGRAGGHVRRHPGPVLAVRRLPATAATRASIAAVADGRAAVQDEGSQLVATALATATLDGPDERWLDLAAGPGGKAGLLGAIAAQRGAHLDAVEIAPHRADLVRRTTAGLPVTVHTADGRAPGLDVNAYDRVLLDAPCTGLGALRRRPEARWRRSAERRRPSWCSSSRSCSTPRPPMCGSAGSSPTSPVRRIWPRLSASSGDGPSSWSCATPDRSCPGVPDLGDGPTVQLWPHRHGTDGMFLALLRRRS